MKLFLEWSAYENAGMGDAYADIPKHGADYAKAVAVCIGSKQCEQQDKGGMCPSCRISHRPGLSSGGRIKLLKAALNAEDERAFLGAELALFPALRAEPEALIVSNGFSCQQQIDNGGFGKPLHLAEVLCLATGVMS